MNIGRIGSTISTGVETLGKTVNNSENLKKVGKFFDPNGKSVSSGVFLALMLSCVLFPRMLNARDKTEKREIFTRDAISISTMLFAMKGINGGLAKGAQKKMGVVLTDMVVPKEMNIFKKFLQFVKPNGGVNILSTEQLVSKYKVETPGALIGLLDFIEGNGGNVEKALTIDAKSKKAALAPLVKKLMGENFNGKITKETVTGAINNKNNSKVVGQIIDILSKEESNPLLKNAKFVNSGLKTLTLAVIVSILGIGLPKLNIFLSKKLDKKEHENNTARPEHKKENIFIKRLTDAQVKTFQNFLGATNI